MKILMFLKEWFLSHQSITGSLIGLFGGFLLGAIDSSKPLFFSAPFIAGFVAGFLKGNGWKAGILTLLLPITMIIAMPLVIPNFDWTSSEMPVVTGIGPINATFAALSNGLIRSTWGIAHGFAALGGILAIIVLILIPIMIGVGLIVTAILGTIGAIVGRFTRNHIF